MSIHSARKFRAVILSAAIIASAGVTAARADFILTPPAQGLGYQLTTFVDGFQTPNDLHQTVPTNEGQSWGPMGVAFAPGGKVLVSEFSTGNIYVLPSDANGQHISSPSVQMNFSFGAFNAAGMTQLGSTVYLAGYGAGQVFALNFDGTKKAGQRADNSDNAHILADQFPLGIDADPATGMLYISNSKSLAPPGQNSILKQNSASHDSATLVTNHPFIAPGGIGLSADGSIVYSIWTDSGGALKAHYTADTEHEVFSAITDAGISDPNYLIGSSNVEGLAVGTGALTGHVIINTADGRLLDVNTLDNSRTLIAQENTNLNLAGSLLTVDPDGSLLITRPNSILRLTAPAGSGYLAVPAGVASVPEPASVSLLALGALGLLSKKSRR